MNEVKDSKTDRQHRVNRWCIYLKGGQTGTGVANGTVALQTCVGILWCGWPLHWSSRHVSLGYNALFLFVQLLFFGGGGGGAGGEKEGRGAAGDDGGGDWGDNARRLRSWQRPGYGNKELFSHTDSHTDTHSHHKHHGCPFNSLTPAPPPRPLPPYLLSAHLLTSTPQPPMPSQEWCKRHTFIAKMSTIKIVLETGCSVYDKSDSCERAGRPVISDQAVLCLHPSNTRGWCQSRWQASPLHSSP